MQFNKIIDSEESIDFKVMLGGVVSQLTNPVDPVNLPVFAIDHCTELCSATLHYDLGFGALFM